MRLLIISPALIYIILSWYAYFTHRYDLGSTIILTILSLFMIMVLLGPIINFRGNNNGTG